MYKVIPAILATNIADFKEKHELLSSFSDEIQIDIADGEFVDNKTVTLEEIENLKEDKIYEIHLMVSNPLEYLEECQRLKIKRAAFHSEIKSDVEEVINKIKKYNFEVVLAVNPETKITDIEMHIRNIDRILLMSVEPGFGGQKLIRSVLGKAKKLREKYPDLIIEMDGGINIGNIQDVFESRVNVAIVGSGILKAGDPKREWKKLLTVSKKLNIKNQISK